MEYSTTDPSRMAFMIPHVIFWAVCHRQEIICKLAFMILLYSSKEFQKTKNNACGFLTVFPCRFYLHLIETCYLIIATHPANDPQVHSYPQAVL